MEKKKNSSKLGLAAKAAAIFGAAFAALTGVNSEPARISQTEDFNPNTISFASIKKAKPMPVLKLNLATGKNQMVASHSSHSSHRSHSSHSSHYSSSRFS